MNVAPNSPLIELATTAVIESERTKYPMQRFVARRYAQAALVACEAELLVKELRLAKNRLEILLGRARACHEETGQHGVSLVEAPAWIEDMEALLARLEGKV